MQFNSTNSFNNFALINLERNFVQDPNEIIFPKQVATPAATKKYFGISRNQSASHTLGNLNNAKNNGVLKEHVIQNIIDQNQNLKSIESVPLSLHE